MTASKAGSTQHNKTPLERKRRRSLSYRSKPAAEPQKQPIAPLTPEDVADFKEMSDYEIEVAISDPETPEGTKVCLKDLLDKVENLPPIKFKKKENGE